MSHNKRRRKWSPAQKLRIVLETRNPTASWRRFAGARGSHPTWSISGVCNCWARRGENIGWLNWRHGAEDPNRISVGVCLGDTFLAGFI